MARSLALNNFFSFFLTGEDKILVTSNDSRIRLYDLRDLNLSCKYKGYLNVSSQIKASFSHDGKFIVAGSENQCIYIWKTHHDYAKLSSVSFFICRSFLNLIIIIIVFNLDTKRPKRLLGRN